MLQPYIDLRIPQGYDLKKAIESLTYHYESLRRDEFSRPMALLNYDIAEKLKEYKSVPSRGLSIQVRQGEIVTFKVPYEAILKFHYEAYHTEQ